VKIFLKEFQGVPSLCKIKPMVTEAWEQQQSHPKVMPTI
jgi:hypothetical protein